MNRDRINFLLEVAVTAANVACITKDTPVHASAAAVAVEAFRQIKDEMFDNGED